MIKIYKKISLALINTLWLWPAVAVAQNAPYVDPGLYATANAAGLPTGGSPIAIVASVINVVLGILGVVFVVLIIYAGWQWMTAAGNEEKITQAKKMIGGAIVGLIIILASYAITTFIYSGVKKSTLSPPAAVVTPP